MIDTHTHVSRRFGENVEEIVKGAKDSGLDWIVLAASNVEESDENIRLAREYGIFAAAVGVHPQQTDPENDMSIDEQINRLDELAKNEEVVAVGECGLDYSPVLPEEKERSQRDQEILFRGQICVAVKHKLPLIIHSRKTMDEVIEILSQYPKTFGVIHCYTGGKKRIQKIIDLGDKWYFGIDGNVTYEDGLVDVVAQIPKDRLILETDSPFLTPMPHRGETNKPEYIKYIYQKVAEVWKLGLKETEEIIDSNAKRLFNLL